MTEKLLTSKQAYEAMYSFLEAYYERGASDEIGYMLGNMSLLSDGTSADPAYTEDWNEAVKKVIEGKVDARLEIGGLNDT